MIVVILGTVSLSRDLRARGGKIASGVIFPLDEEQAEKERPVPPL